MSFTSWLADLPMRKLSLKEKATEAWITNLTSLQVTIIQLELLIGFHLSNLAMVTKPSHPDQNINKNQTPMAFNLRGKDARNQIHGKKITKKEKESKMIENSSNSFLTIVRKISLLLPKMLFTG
jgi:hypothetical protein